jgi:protein SCO1/2
MSFLSPSIFWLRAVAIVWATLLTASFACAAEAAKPTLSDSIYHLKMNLVDQRGTEFTLEDRKGQPMLISMFYTSCQFVCPMLVDALKSTESKLRNEERSRLNVLLVTFDPVHDSVEVLKKTANQHQIEGDRWSFSRSDAKSVRKLAAMLGIQYKALPNGEFNHTTALILIDANGRIKGRTTRLGDADASFVKLIKTTLNEK